MMSDRLTGVIGYGVNVKASMALFKNTHDHTL